jgi:hypothetical protein
MLGWARYGFHKKHARTSYTELVFLHPMGYVGHVVHFGASGPRNIDTLFFVLGWNQYGINKKRTRTHYTELIFLHSVGSAGHIVHSAVSGARNVNALFSSSGGPGVISIKSAPGHVTPNIYSCIRWYLRVT